MSSQIFQGILQLGYRIKIRDITFIYRDSEPHDQTQGGFESQFTFPNEPSPDVCTPTAYMSDWQSQHPQDLDHLALD